MGGDGEREREMSEYQVVSWQEEHRVELARRTEVKRFGGSLWRAYHPYRNPSSSRCGSEEFRSLLADMRSGSLWRACAELAETFRSQTTYAQSQQVLMTHQIALWRHNKYGRARLASPNSDKPNDRPHQPLVNQTNPTASDYSLDLGQ